MQERRVLKFRWTKKRGSEATAGLPICTMYVDEDEAAVALGGDEAMKWVCLAMWGARAYGNTFAERFDGRALVDDAYGETVAIEACRAHGMSLQRVVAEKSVMDVYLLEKK